jgi:hypothetical protein
LLRRPRLLPSLLLLLSLVSWVTAFAWAAAYSPQDPRHGNPPTNPTRSGVFTVYHVCDQIPASFISSIEGVLASKTSKLSPADRAALRFAADALRARRADFVPCSRCSTGVAGEQQLSH